MIETANSMLSCNFCQVAQFREVASHIDYRKVKEDWEKLGLPVYWSDRPLPSKCEVSVPLFCILYLSCPWRGSDVTHQSVQATRFILLLLLLMSLRLLYMTLLLLFLLLSSSLSLASYYLFSCFSSSLIVSMSSLFNGHMFACIQT